VKLPGNALALLLLGGEQHGHIVDVGYDTYVELIEEAVSEVKGTPIRRRVLPPFEIAIDRKSVV